MYKVSKDRLEAIVLRINKLTKSPETQYTRKKDGKLKANIGNYHLDWAYGGVGLRRMHSEGGGIVDVIPGFHTKRELESRLFAFISGLEAQS